MGRKMVRELSDHDKKKGTALLRAIDAFTEKRIAMPAQYIRTFLLVALEEGKSVGEYAVKSGVSPSVMSRHILDLGQFTRSREPGLDLVYTKQNLANLREHNVFLTEKGRTLYHKLTRALED
jgi:DNA-binding MarR family transcriptional regulator